MNESRSTPAAIVITGATGTGKSELAVRVAEIVDGELISADSRQVYREMDVGTAKPAVALRERVRHHGLDVLDPGESYSAGAFATDSWRSIEGILHRGRVPIVVGGTGLYIRALLSPLSPEPVADAEQKERLRRYLERLSTDELKRWLAKLDPRRASQLRNEGGRQRLCRSLEVTLGSGCPHSFWLERTPDTPPLTAAVFCLQLPREELYRRIDARFDGMMEAGLLAEVRRLSERYPVDAPGLSSVGYAELAGHVAGNSTLEQAVEEAKRNTRHFARRQLTWFRHQLPRETTWLDATRPVGELADEIAGVWRSFSIDTGSGARPQVAS